MLNKIYTILQFKAIIFNDSKFGNSTKYISYQ